MTVHSGLPYSNETRNTGTAEVFMPLWLGEKRRVGRGSEMEDSLPFLS